MATTARFRDLKPLAVGTAPTLAFAKTRRRIGLYVQNPTGSGVTMEAHILGTAVHGEGLVIEEGQCWYPAGAVPSNEIYVTASGPATARVTEAIKW